MGSIWSQRSKSIFSDINWIGVAVWVAVVLYLCVGVAVATFACEQTLKSGDYTDCDGDPVIFFEFIILIPLWPAWFVYMFLHWIFKDK